MILQVLNLTAPIHRMFPSLPHRPSVAAFWCSNFPQILGRQSTSHFCRNLPNHTSDFGRKTIVLVNLSKKIQYTSENQVGTPNNGGLVLPGSLTVRFPLKISHPKRKVIFQPSFFRDYLKLGGCRYFSVNFKFQLFFWRCHIANSSTL